MPWKAIAAAAIIALLGAGCGPFPAPAGQVPEKAATEGWKGVSDGVERYECTAQLCGHRLILYSFDPGSYSFRFAERAEPLTVEGWSKAEPDAVFAANGLFFDENREATGLLISGGEVVQEKRYDYEKSGIAELAPEARVIDTANEEFDTGLMSEAGQSFPLLIRKGEAVASFKDAKAARRTAIGSDKDGRLIFAFVPEDAVTFADFAQLLERTGVEWVNALNLDGGTSTGFSARFDGWSEAINSIVQVPNAIIAQKKP